MAIVESKDLIYQKEESIVSRRIVDEVILVPVQNNIATTGCVFTLNETGAYTWNLIDGKRRVKEIQEALLQEFDVPPEKLEEDLTKLLDQLKEIGAITSAA